MDWMNLANVNLIKGKGGGDPRNGLCIMEMVSWFDGANTVTDHPSCASPFLTSLAIVVNDSAPNQEERNTLKPLLPLLSGSVDPENERARAWFAMRELALRVVAARCDELGKADLSAKLREAADPKALTVAMREVREALRASASASAYAYASASAYAYAYASAYADAYASAYAYADAYASAYASASASAYASAYAYASKKGEKALEAFREERRLHLWRITRDVLFEATKLGAHGGLDLGIVPAREAQLMKAMERAL